MEIPDAEQPLYFERRIRSMSGPVREAMWRLLEQFADQYHPKAGVYKVENWEYCWVYKMGSRRQPWLTIQITELQTPVLAKTRNELCELRVVCHQPLACKPDYDEAVAFIETTYDSVEQNAKELTPKQKARAKKQKEVIEAYESANWQTRNGL